MVDEKKHSRLEGAANFPAGLPSAALNRGIDPNLTRDTGILAGEGKVVRVNKSSTGKPQTDLDIYIENSGMYPDLADRGWRVRDRFGVCARVGGRYEAGTPCA